jgi:hypothetical protein
MARPRVLIPIKKKCEGCGVMFLATTSYAITKQRWCSRTCSLPVVQAAKRVPKVKRSCEQCSKAIKRVPSHFANRDHVFCSNACRGQWRSDHGDLFGENNAQWKGGSATWWKQRARERDDFTCQVDGCDVRDEGKGTHAHHKLPREAGGDDALDNLVTLCDHHHQVAERQLILRVFELAPDIVRRAITEMYG